QLFSPGGNQFAVTAQNATVRADGDQRVVNGADANGTALVHTQHHVDLALTTNLRNLLDLGTGHFDGRFAQALEPRAAVDRVHHPAPVGVTGDEHLGKGDQLGTVVGCFIDQTTYFFDGRIRVQEHRRCLNGGGLELTQFQHHALLYLVLGGHVHDGVTQFADAFHHSMHHVARPHPLLRITASAHAFWCTGGDDVTGFQRDAGADVSDQVIHVEQHVLGDRKS